MENKVKVPPSMTLNDLPIDGLVLGLQNDNITYTSKKTGQQVEAKRDVIVLQTAHGIVLARSFASDGKTEFVQSLKVGDNVSLPMTSFAIENGVKTANVRLS